MSKIIKIDGNTVTIGMDDGEMTKVPLESINYENPQVGDDVKLFKDENTIIVIRTNATNAQTIYETTAYVAKEQSINKHIFVWIGTFLFGNIGVDRFMRGQIGFGILKLLTVGGCGIWSLVDFIIGVVKAYGNEFNEDENITFIDGKYTK